MGICLAVPAVVDNLSGDRATKYAGESTQGGTLERQQRIALFEQSLRENNGQLYVYGVLQRANSNNRNGRIYPKGILESEAARYHAARVITGTAYGEADHPPHSSPNFRSVTQANVSHRVLDYRWQGDDLVGTVEVLQTPAGRMVYDLYAAGYALGMSSRSWASLMQAGSQVFIGKDMELICFDFVSDPSTPGAILVPLPVTYRGAG